MVTLQTEQDPGIHYSFPKPLDPLRDPQNSTPKPKQKTEVQLKKELEIAINKLKSNKAPPEG